MARIRFEDCACHPCGPHGKDLRRNRVPSRLRGSRRQDARRLGRTRPRSLGHRVQEPLATGCLRLRGQDAQPEPRRRRDLCHHALRPAALQRADGIPEPRRLHGGRRRSSCSRILSGDAIKMRPNEKTVGTSPSCQLPRGVWMASRTGSPFPPLQPRVPRQRDGAGAEAGTDAPDAVGPLQPVEAPTRLPAALAADAVKVVPQAGREVDSGSRAPASTTPGASRP